MLVEWTFPKVSFLTTAVLFVTVVITVSLAITPSGAQHASPRSTLEVTRRTFFHIFIGQEASLIIRIFLWKLIALCVFRPLEAYDPKDRLTALFGVLTQESARGDALACIHITLWNQNGASKKHEVFVTIGLYKCREER